MLYEHLERLTNEDNQANKIMRVKENKSSDKLTILYAIHTFNDIFM